MPGKHWRLRVLAVCVCLGAYWSASGLLQLHEVFARPHATPTPSSSSPSPSAVGSVHEQTPLTKPVYGRLVVVLIDALRADMILGSEAMYGSPSVIHSEGGASAAATESIELNQHMPYTSGLVTSGHALAYVSHASVPTVTMPRLKALLTGKPPAFIDLLKNFNSAALEDDNLLQRFRARGDRIVFYGDDTWLKLFPESSQFQRQEGTSGFYTRDTVEVDENVTRHLRDELDPSMRHPKSRDWDVLVLHYLGLDHVGHLRGPRSTMMMDKLHEMDSVIQRIHDSVGQQDQLRRREARTKGSGSDNQPTLILLCSDHGMSEVGNHGGATIEESSAVLAFVRGDLQPMNPLVRSQQRRHQVDVVPTIATLFGLGIPTYSTGLLLDEVVQATAEAHASTRDPPDSQPSEGLQRETSTAASRLLYLQALHTNFLQLRSLAFIKMSGTELSTFDLEHNALIQRVEESLRSLPHQQEATVIALSSELRTVCQVLQNRVGRSDGSEYDLPSVAGGVVLLLLCAVCALLTLRSAIHTRLHRMERLVDASVSDVVVVASSILQIASLSSSSSIENEHATSFFTVTTLLFAMLVSSLRTVTMRNTTGAMSTQRPVILLLVVLLIGNRILRHRNQVINFGRLNALHVDSSITGNELANDDSLSILSTAPLVDHVLVYPGCILMIYVTTTWKLLVQRPSIEHTRDESTYPKWILGCMHIVHLIGISASGLCMYLAGLPDTITARWGGLDADNMAQVAYGMAMLLLVSAIIITAARHLQGTVSHGTPAWNCQIRNEDGYLPSAMVEIALWILTLVVQRGSNLPTLAVLRVQSAVLDRMIRICSTPAQAVTSDCSLRHAGPRFSTIVCTMMVLWQCFVAFFALGNSHLVTTIDISQSYHGLQGYSQALVGLFTWINIFSGPLIFMVGCMNGVRVASMATTSAATLLLYQALRMAVYTIVVYFMRFHLFIWSVFAPKMLYEVAFTCFVAASAFSITLHTDTAGSLK